jgi:hypothetical protein
MDKKSLLEALQKDLAATELMRQLLLDQINKEEEQYWSDGIEAWIDRRKEQIINYSAINLTLQNEELMRSWFKSLE